MAKKQIDFWSSLEANKDSFISYVKRLLELSISTFKWNNLPNTIDERFMELVLFSEGKTVFFKDEVMGYLCLKVAVNGNLSVYGIPQRYRAYSSYNGYNKQLDYNNSVLIYNNLIHTNTLPEVYKYSERLYELDRIIDINAKAQKTPLLILCDEHERLTMTNLYMKYDGNTPIIYGNKNINMDNFKVLTTGAPYLCDKLYMLKTQTWNEALTYLGISNLTIQKKERLITDEVERNQGGTIASRNSRLKARQIAAEKINEMFGLNISVEFREDITDDYDKEDEEIIDENKMEVQEQ